MATRTRTSTYFQLRSQSKLAPSTGDIIAEKPLLLKEGYEPVELEAGKKSKPPPQWLTIIDDINYDLSAIKTKLNELSEAHKEHLKPFASEEPVNEQLSVESLTVKISELFHKTQQKISALEHEKMSSQEVPMRENAQKILMEKLHELSTQFKNKQKDYLTKLQTRNARGKTFNIVEDENNGTIKVDFTSMQAQSVATSTAIVDRRVEEIRMIAKSVNELAMIFKDMAMLVTEQGTILDRIDYNIEQTSHNVDTAVEQIKQAEKEQGKYRNKLCMLLLCIGIFILIIILIIKNTAFNTNTNTTTGSTTTGSSTTTSSGTTTQ